VAQDRIFVGSADDKFYAFDAATGTLRNLWEGAWSDIISTAAISSGRIFFVSANGNLHGLSMHDGAGLPGFPLSVPQAHASSPAVGEGHLIVVSGDKHVYSYSAATGDLQWSTLLTNVADSSPLIANGIVYVNSFGGYPPKGGLYALDASTGAILWRAPISTYDLASPAVADGIVFIGSTDGYLYAFSVDGVAPSSRLRGGQLGIKPALSSLRPDPSLKLSRK
jgi:outer membrane protein assembly factor BamB